MKAQRIHMVVRERENEKIHILTLSNDSFTYISNVFFFSSRRRHTRSLRDWSSDVCSSDLTGAGDPKELFFAPITAVRNLMKKEGTKIGDYDLIEANEAFASQALADGAALGWDWNRVNVNGGAIAIGHPIGASGARVLTTLLYAMRDRDAHTGLATLCLGGGNAVALSVERMN